MTLFYSTSKAINDAYSSSLRIPVLNSIELDDNMDGVTDRLELSIRMPISSTEKITGISLLTYFDITINGKARLLIDAVSFINYDSSKSMSKLRIDGDLMFRQTWPLNTKGG